MSLISQLFLLAISKPIKKKEKKNKANVTNDLFDLYSLYPSISYRLWKTDRCCCCTCPMSAVIWCFLVGAGYKAGNQLPGVSFVTHTERAEMHQGQHGSAFPLMPHVYNYSELTAQY